MPSKIIDPKLVVLAELQFADHGAQRHLRRLHIHFVQKLPYLHDDLAITQNNNGVRALIGDDLGIADRDGLGSRIDRLRR